MGIKFARIQAIISWSGNAGHCHGFCTGVRMTAVGWGQA
jgi:hypothetical protein